MSIDYKTLAARISYLCERDGITASKMLQEAGLSKSVMDNIKRGRTPSSEIILAIATYFNVSTDYLFARSDNPNLSPNTEGAVSEINPIDWLRKGLRCRGVIDADSNLSDEQLAIALENLESLIKILAKQNKL